MGGAVPVGGPSMGTGGGGCGPPPVVSVEVAQGFGVVGCVPVDCPVEVAHGSLSVDGYTYWWCDPER